MKYDYYYRGEKIPFAPRDMNDEEAQELAIHDEHYKKIYEEQVKRKTKYKDKLKVGRRIYCKYCYKNTKPVINWWDGLIKCGTCDYGLYPIQSDEDIEHFIKCRNFDSKMSIQEICWNSLSRESQKKFIPENQEPEDQPFFVK